MSDCLDPRETDRSPVILLADDDEAVREITRRAFDVAGIGKKMYVVSDGEQAMDFLLRRNKFADGAASPRPDIILLDLNMPRKSGLQVLKELRDLPELRRIPVVVLTTSSAEEDIARSYDLGCHSFITKPLTVGGFIEAAERLNRYWFQLVSLPA